MPIILWGLNPIYSPARSLFSGNSRASRDNNKRQRRARYQPGASAPGIKRLKQGGLKARSIMNIMIQPFEDIVLALVAFGD